MSEVDLTDVAQEGAGNPFDSLIVESNEQGKETPAESSTEPKPTETTPSQEGVNAEAKGEKVDPAKANIPDDNEKLPLNKSKRWKEVREQNEAMRAQLAAMQEAHSKELAEIKSFIQNSHKSTKSEVPPAFKKLFGEGNEELWKEWQTLFPSGQSVDVNELKAQVLSEFEKKQAEKEQASKKQVEWVENELTKLKEDGLKFDKNELLSILEKYTPTDGNGMLDFRKGYELLEMFNKAKPANQRKEVRKTLAANTSPQGVSEPTASDVVDVSKIRKANWRDIVKF